MNIWCNFAGGSVSVTVYVGWIALGHSGYLSASCVLSAIDMSLFTARRRKWSAEGFESKPQFRGKPSGFYKTMCRQW